MTNLEDRVSALKRWASNRIEECLRTESMHGFYESDSPVTFIIARTELRTLQAVLKILEEP